MRLGELLADPGLGLRLLVGAIEPDPEFRWIYVTDLRDPRRYLGGGEVVLTGMLWYHDPGDAEAFVSAIAEMGVVALGVGTAEIGPVTFDVVADACRRHSVRLFTVPLDVSFTSITQRVVSALAAEHVRRSSAVLEHHRRLVAVLGSGAGLDGLVAAGSVELGVPCWVIAPTGRVVAGVTDLPDSAAVAAGFVTGKRQVGSYSMLPVGTGHRLACWALVVADRTADRHEIAVELATLIGLERSALAAGRVGERRSATQLLSLLADESTPAADISARLTAAGFGPDDSLCVVSMTITGEAGLALDVLDSLVEGLVTDVDGEAVAITLAGNDLLDSLRSGVRALEPGLGPCRLALGISSPGPASRLRASVDEARYARGVAVHNGAHAAVVAGSELASHQLLFGALPDELRQSFCRRLLGPVRAYDQEHHSELLESLRVFLDCSGSWSQAAARLHLHVNTLRYRIGRVEDLTGRDLSRFADRVDLFLALELSR
ncbi:PucR family transcriptional regulator [Kutzneria sp. 744]|uniref:PucR family transcriptional regulator n=1 Tax=Kutzneria sp. (strain 744) TaxID=345341 RepID=UPI0003EEDA6E|nr:PucR family transcriptional regulator [Kutzneria sp. 744]EWM19494.1 vegetative cell wall protein gp1 [Kutzneria sp. 744]